MRQGLWALNMQANWRILEGAKVTLTNKKSKKKATLTTDVFGDFWFERQEPGKYSLVIEKTGYLPRKVDLIEADKDLNLGDFELYKKAA